MNILAVILISSVTALITVMLLARFSLRRAARFAGLIPGSNFPRSCVSSCKGNHDTSTQQCQDTLNALTQQLRLDDAQQQQWETLTKSFLQATAELRSYRDALHETNSMSQKLNRLEDFLGDTLIVLRQFKPKLQAFYTSLDREQQRTFDGWLQQRRC
jgi:hypothetical protein